EGMLNTAMYWLPAPQVWNALFLHPSIPPSPTTASLSSFIAMALLLWVVGWRDERTDASAPWGVVALVLTMSCGPVLAMCATGTMAEPLALLTLAIMVRALWTEKMTGLRWL